MPRRAIALAACLISAILIVPLAAANDQVSRYIIYGASSHIRGTRATVDNPSSAEARIFQNDFFVTSAYADDRVNNLIQVGVQLEWKAGQGPSCNLGSSSASLYFLTEVDVNGSYSCWNVGTTTYSTTHLQPVKLDSGSGGYWRSYIDGTWTGIANQWSNCGGYACLIAAFGEEFQTGAGTWNAKFAGAGNTPWQLTGDSTNWDTILSATSSLGFYWSGPTGPFPGGIWKFVYSH